MSSSPLDTSINEQLAEAAFSRQSGVFDEIYSSSTIVQYKRERVRRHVLSFLGPGSHILELNCGTGEDAIFFAGMGHQVHATDLSGGMLEQLEKKIEARHLGARITFELCSYTALDTLQVKGPFDLIFSNFAGLNCTGDLARVASSFSPLLKPGGMVTVVLLPPFCLWETLLVFKGKFKTGLRRFFSGKGRKARVEGLPFRCWYHTPSVLQKALGREFETLDLEGLCTLVPPSYMDGFAEKHPTLYEYLVNQEKKRCRRWPWRHVGDYYILTLRKKN